VLEVVVPYSQQSLEAFLGERPAQSCSPETARRMALRARDRAAWLAPGLTVAGVGCTASLASDRPKQGPHRFHVAIVVGQRVVTRSLVLAKGKRDRAGEEEVLAGVLLNAMAEAFAIRSRAEVLLLEGEAETIDPGADIDPLVELLSGKLTAVCAEADGRLNPDAPRPAALLPGSFNPLHRGHRELAACAARRLAQAVAFELSVHNVDKPDLDAEEVRRRAVAFAWHHSLWLTRAPTFAEKAERFPGCWFVVGVDTAARIIDPRYYGGPESMMQALARIRDVGCRFLVGGRADAAGRFLGLEHLTLGEGFAGLFEAIPSDEFRVDLSSTELRPKA
jgi:hypothetical protein